MPDYKALREKLQIEIARLKNCWDTEDENSDKETAIGVSVVGMLMNDWQLTYKIIAASEEGVVWQYKGHGAKTWDSFEEFIDRFMQLLYSSSTLPPDEEAMLALLGVSHLDTENTASVAQRSAFNERLNKLERLRENADQLYAFWAREVDDLIEEKSRILSVCRLLRDDWGITYDRVPDSSGTVWKFYGHGDKVWKSFQAGLRAAVWAAITSSESPTIYHFDKTFCLRPEIPTRHESSWTPDRLHLWSMYISFDGMCNSKQHDDYALEASRLKVLRILKDEWSVEFETGESGCTWSFGEYRSDPWNELDDAIYEVVDAILCGTWPPRMPRTPDEGEFISVEEAQVSWVDHLLASIQEDLQRRRGQEEV